MRERKRDFWVDYSDVTGSLVRIPGKSRLIRYFNLLRYTSIQCLRYPELGFHVSIFQSLVICCHNFYGPMIPDLNRLDELEKDWGEEIDVADGSRCSI